MIELDYQAIGQRIAKFRKLNGWTAEKLAERAGAGLSRSTIAKVEKNLRTSLDVEQVLAIAWALGVPPAALLFPVDRPDDEVLVDGKPHSVAEMIDWFHGWQRSNPFDLSATNAGLGVASILRALESLSRAKQRRDAINEEQQTANLTGIVENAQNELWNRALDDAERDIESQQRLLSTLVTAFGSDSTDG